MAPSSSKNSRQKAACFKRMEHMRSRLQKMTIVDVMARVNVSLYEFDAAKKPYGRSKGGAPASQSRPRSAAFTSR